MNGKSYLNKMEIIEPDFSSPLTDLIIELDHLRKKELFGSTHPQIFFQLKEIFHFLESLESARIEGNRTTLAELVERKIENAPVRDEEFAEIENLEKGIAFVDENIEGARIDRIFISELHKIVVKDLSTQKEGDPTPGQYRKTNVKIAKAAHVPPDFNQVRGYMEDLIEFFNTDHPHKYDLLKTTLAHHRFLWIHPFQNGNGRTVRLITYAMLVKQGFHVNVGRILNPTAIFCNDRQKYYALLASADSCAREDLVNWCTYVLGGLKTEIEKIDRLLDYNFLSKNILLPAISFSLERKIITDTEEKILNIAAQKQVFQARHVKTIFPRKIPAEISRLLRGLKDKKMIVGIEGKDTRKYYINFYNNFLLRGIIEMLGRAGFLPLKKQELS
ncbi:MAG: Fic family protein [bacterium]